MPDLLGEEPYSCCPYSLLVMGCRQQTINMINDTVHQKVINEMESRKNIIKGIESAGVKVGWRDRLRFQIGWSAPLRG